MLQAIELGVPGMLLFILILIIFFLDIEGKYARENIEAKGVFYLVLGVSMSSIVITNLFGDLIETDKIGFFFFLLMGISLVVPALGKSSTTNHA